MFEEKTTNFISITKKLLKLDFAKSAVELLKAETDVKPIYDAFKQIYLLNNAFRGIRFSASIGDNDEKMSDSTTLRENKVLTPLENLFLLYKNGLSEFEQIKSDFISIFTLVEEINFSTIRLFDGMTVPILRIREKGVDKWIYQDEISSGMLRTLSQIITLTLAKDGDVILVDEFENGLGVNCIDKLTDQIEFADKNIQVIITSHHPYIIKHIPVQRWKIVTRDKSDVKVFTAAELHIGEHSRHDAFMQLIQKEEFKTGRR